MPFILYLVNGMVPQCILHVVHVGCVTEGIQRQKRRCDLEVGNPRVWRKYVAGTHVSFNTSSTLLPGAEEYCCLGVGIQPSECSYIM